MSNKGTSLAELAPTKLSMIAGAISTPSIRDFTIEMMKVAPPSFREARASRSHHPPDERVSHGNSLHTLRVVELVGIIAESCSLGQFAVDILVSAAILHDICRYGLDDESEASDKEHPYHVRELAKRHSITCKYYDETIFRIIEHHMGRWDSRTPYVLGLALDDILHIADVISASAEQVWEQLK